MKMKNPAHDTIVQFFAGASRSARDVHLSKSRKLHYHIVDRQGRIEGAVKAAGATLGEHFDFTYHCAALDQIDLTEIDCIVTPGNSFGHMTGGFDQAVVTVLGEWTQRRVLEAIEATGFNELNVGSAVRVESTGAIFGRTKHLIYAPTMRVPKPLPLKSDVPYLVMLAALKEIHAYNCDQEGSFAPQPIKHVLVPLLGQGTGGLDPITVFLQLLAAIYRYQNPMPVNTLFDDGTWINAMATNGIYPDLLSRLRKAPIYLIGEEITMTSREEVEELCNFCDQPAEYKIVTTTDMGGEHPVFDFCCAKHRDNLPTL